MGIDWIVLTMGDRPSQLRTAVESIEAVLGPDDGITVVANGCRPPEFGDLPDVRVIVSAENLGVPGGRHVGVTATNRPLIGFLDDDAFFETGYELLWSTFGDCADLAAVSLRITDRDGRTSPRHVPRPGGRGADISGPVTTFLGGASVVRRCAYDAVGGYFIDLFYGHEELELSWRLIDQGWNVHYLADVRVVHPHTDIAGHDRGWWLTGRNRVWIARRTLPWPVALLHTAFWLVLGAIRSRHSRTSYLSGWWSGWRTEWSQVGLRRPVGWGAVWRLTRGGRPPIV